MHHPPFALKSDLCQKTDVYAWSCEDLYVTLCLPACPLSVCYCLAMCLCVVSVSPVVSFESRWRSCVSSSIIEGR